ncbi:hypothetical protein [Escherichia phage PJNS034]
MITIGDRVLYRYSPAGLPVYGVVADVFQGVAAVRVNIENPNQTRSGTKALVMYRKVESWEPLSEKSPLHDDFVLLVLPHNVRIWIVKQLKRHSVTPVMLEKLMDMSRV